MQRLMVLTGLTGPLLANRAMFLPGLRVSLLLVGSVTLAAAVATPLLKPSTPR